MHKQKLAYPQAEEGKGNRTPGKQRGLAVEPEPKQAERVHCPGKPIGSAHVTRQAETEEPGILGQPRETGRVAGSAQLLGVVELVQELQRYTLARAEELAWELLMRQV